MIFRVHLATGLISTRSRACTTWRFRDSSDSSYLDCDSLRLEDFCLLENTGLFVVFVAPDANEGFAVAGTKQRGRRILRVRGRGFVCLNGWMITGTKNAGMAGTGCLVNL